MPCESQADGPVRQSDASAQFGFEGEIYNGDFFSASHFETTVGALTILVTSTTKTVDRLLTSPIDEPSVFAAHGRAAAG